MERLLSSWRKRKRHTIHACIQVRMIEHWFFCCVFFFLLLLLLPTFTPSKVCDFWIEVYLKWYILLERIVPLSISLAGTKYPLELFSSLFSSTRKSLSTKSAKMPHVAIVGHLHFYFCSKRKKENIFNRTIELFFRLLSRHKYFK